MVKASHGKTAITDGSEALINEFAFLSYPSNRKAGLDTFAKANNYSEMDENDRRYYKLKPLGGKGEWQNTACRKQENGDVQYAFSNGETIVWGGKEDWKEIDKLYKQHLIDFWKPYNFSFLDGFNYEIKDIYEDIVLLNVANYGMRTLSGEFKIKVRGTKLAEQVEGFSIHPREQIYRDILNGQPVYPVPLYQSQEPIKLAGWQSNSKLREEYLPADSRDQAKYPSLFSASQFTYQTKADKERWSKYEDRLREKTGYSLEFDALTPDGAIDISKARAIQNRISRRDKPYLPQNPIFRPGFEAWRNRT